jgi:hypothetical protein
VQMLHDVISSSYRSIESPAMSDSDEMLPSPDEILHYQKEQCRICGEVAHGKHFGALSCKACAAFFRRTVTKQRHYVCIKDRKCSNTRNIGNRLCSSCRYERCLNVGMKVTSVMSVLCVQAAYNLAPISDGPFQRLVGFRQMIPAKRAERLKVFGCERRFAGRPACKGTIVKALWSEVRVLRDFLCDFGSDFYGQLRHDITPNMLAETFFGEWHLFEMILSTARNEGHLSRKVYFVDESFADTTKAGMSRFYGSDGNMRDLESVIRYCQEKLCIFLDVVHAFSAAKMDDVELAALLQLSLVQRHADVFKSRAELNEYVNRILTQLHNHHRMTYKEYDVRLDRVLMLLAEISIVRRIFDEMAAFLELSTLQITQHGRDPCTNLDCQAALRFQLSPLVQA